MQTQTWLRLCFVLAVSNTLSVFLLFAGILIHLLIRVLLLSRNAVLPPCDLLTSLVSVKSSFS